MHRRNAPCEAVNSARQCMDNGMLVLRVERQIYIPYCQIDPASAPADLLLTATKRLLQHQKPCNVILINAALHSAQIHDEQCMW